MKFPNYNFYDYKHLEKDHHIVWETFHFLNDIYQAV